MTDVRLQVALLCSTNDMKAEKQFTPFLDSGADCFCSLCNYDKKRPGAGKAFSFLRQSRSCIQKPGWKLRSQAVLDRQLETASRLKESKQDFVAYCQRHGLRYTNFNVRRLRPATPTATRHDTCLLHPQLHARSAFWVTIVSRKLGVDPCSTTRMSSSVSRAQPPGGPSSRTYVGRFSEAGFNHNLVI